MNAFKIFIAAMFCGLSVLADTFYVSTNGTAVVPYSSWSTAATNIQDAVDLTEAEDRILVTNGTYATGTRLTPGYSLPNRLVLTNGATVASVNGPDVTFIEGAGPNGSSAVRCVYLSSGSTLEGFTLTSGHTFSGVEGDADHDRSGGGVWMSSADTVRRCILHDCGAEYLGGGVYANGGQLESCLIWNNETSGWVGGVHNGNLVNCTVVENHSDHDAGGTYSGTLLNCIVSSNTADGNAPNCQGGDLQYCCTTPLPAGTGNITNAPLFADAASGDYHLTTNSPCINVGTNQTWMTGTLDLDGNPRLMAATVDMGAYEFYLSPAINITNENTTVNGEINTYTIGGTNNEWVAGSMLWTNSATSGAGTFPVSNAWQISSIPLALGGNVITVSGTNAVGDTASDSVTITRDPLHTGNSPVHYVSTNGAAVWPYTNWVTAATSIQDAVNAAASNDTVRVTNGVYNAGSAITPGYSCMNRVVITNDITVCSVNGPTATFIEGAEATGGGNGSDAIRGVYMSAGVLSGFTVTNGHTTTSGHSYYDQSGGGVSLISHEGMYSGIGVVSNCTLTDNSAHDGGGGSVFGTLNNCILSGNSAGENGGGSHFGTLNDCTITNNTAANYGGGT